MTPAWVLERLDDPAFVFVEVDEEASTHHWEHMVGATFLDWRDCLRDLQAPAPHGTAAFEELMSRRGIAPEHEVVLFGDAGNRYAAAMLWLMRLHGHRHLHLMDGGRSAWRSAGGRVTDEETVRAATRYRAQRADSDIRVTRDQVREQLEGRRDGVVLDCRTAEEFRGEDTPGEQGRDSLFSVRGHVPGARNLADGWCLDRDGSIRPAAELEQALQAAGVSRGRAITTYCHASERSCLTWFVLREVLDFPVVRVYDGGWREYGNLVGMPIAPGEEIAQGPRSTGPSTRLPYSAQPPS